jgi:hypothetical protein
LKAFELGGRRAAVGAERENDAFGHDVCDDGAAGVSETPCAYDDWGVRVGCDRAGDARRAMQRRLELALEVVVLELRRDEEHSVEGHPDKRQGMPAKLA